MSLSELNDAITVATVNAETHPSDENCEKLRELLRERHELLVEMGVRK